MYLFDLSDLPVEILVNIALQMSISDVLSFGRVSKKIHKKIHEKPYFWKLLLPDIPEKLIYQKRKFNWLLYMIIKFPEKSWNWYGVSKNPNITWEIIQQYPNWQWDWYALSKNSNITWEIIQNNLDQPWDWDAIAINKNITEEIIVQNTDWNFFIFFPIIPVLVGDMFIII